MNLLGPSYTHKDSNTDNASRQSLWEHFFKEREYGHKSLSFSLNIYFQIFIFTSIVCIDRKAINIYSFLFIISVPGSVRDLHIEAHGTTYVLLKWLPPEEPNGRLLGYDIGYQPG